MSIPDLFDEMTYGPAPESPAAANVWLDSHERALKLYIDGAWVAPHGTDKIQVVDPSTEEICGEVPSGNEQDVNW